MGVNKGVLVVPVEMLATALGLSADHKILAVIQDADALMRGEVMVYVEGPAMPRWERGANPDQVPWPEGLTKAQDAQTAHSATLRASEVAFAQEAGKGAPPAPGPVKSPVAVKKADRPVEGGNPDEAEMI